MLGTLSIIPMREGEYQPSTLEPLNLSRGDELVNDTLGVVGKVAKLGLPNNQGIGRRQRISILKSQPV